MIWEATGLVFKVRSEIWILAAEAKTDCCKFSAEIDAVCDGNGNNNNDDDYDFPTIEDILGTALQEQGFPTEDDGTNNTNRGFEKVALGERGPSIDHSGSAPSDSLGKSQGERACYRPSWNRP